MGEFELKCKFCGGTDVRGLQAKILSVFRA